MQPEYPLRTAIAYSLAVLLHFGLLVILSLNTQWSNSKTEAAAPVYVEVWNPDAPQPTDDNIPSTPDPTPTPEQTVQDQKVIAQAEAQAETKRKAQAEAKRKAEAEAKRKAEAEAKRKAQAEAKRKAEAEAKRKAEVEAKRKAEAEAKRKAEAEVKRKAEAEVKRKADEAAALRALQEEILQDRRAAATQEQQVANQAANTQAVDSQNPGSGYKDKVRAKVRPNIVYSGSKIGNPTIEIEVRTDAEGLIINSIVHKPSANPQWDKAILQALSKTQYMPKDINGKVPSPMILRFSPED